jgi:hypothetical protein
VGAVHQRAELAGVDEQHLAAAVAGGRPPPPPPRALKRGGCNIQNYKYLTLGNVR